MLFSNRNKQFTKLLSDQFSSTSDWRIHAFVKEFWEQNSLFYKNNEKYQQIIHKLSESNTSFGFYK
jgi:hypothetical protein